MSADTKHPSTMNQTESTIRTVELPLRWKLRLKRDPFTFAQLACPKKRVTGTIQPLANRSQHQRYVLETGNQKILIYSGPKPSVANEYDHVIYSEQITLGDTELVLQRDAEWKKHPDTITELENSETRDAATKTWKAGINYKREGYISPTEKTDGLRSPQLGSLHAIASHWTLTHAPGIIVMPTGTGKTEVMLAATVAEACTCLLVIVPSDALRTQTADKFATFGILKSFGIVPDTAHYPIVARLTGTPKDKTDLGVLDKVNVIVSTMAALSNASQAVLETLASKCSHLFFDEAHHTPADSWSRLKAAFRNKKTLQFTATPFRRDGKRLEGKILFNYPLAKAQSEGYFKPIGLKEVWEWNDDVADAEIAELAVQTLRTDLKNNLDHVLMARVEGVDRAEQIFQDFYSKHADLNPVVIHQHTPKRRSVLEAIKRLEHKIIVCVDMLGEGFDLPNLKISAIHDPHRSLGVTLQFAGRFTRSNLPNIGNATVIVNMANQRMTDNLEELYSENADWNLLLAKLSNDAITPQVLHSDFHDGVQTISEQPEDEPLSDRMLEPKTSTVVYRSEGFKPDNFANTISKEHELLGSWINREKNVLMFVIKRQESLKWAKTKSVVDEIHDLVVAFYDKDQDLLFIHSSAKSNQRRIADAIGKNIRLIQEEDVFRVLGKIERLMFYSAGLRGTGHGEIRFTMLAGLDIAKAIDPVQMQNSTKSNLFGVGYEDGKRISIGCSRKGTIWAMQSTSIPEWTTWCRKIGKKLLDRGISTEEYLEHTLVPKSIDEFPFDPQDPNTHPLCMDWPFKLYQLLPKTAVFSTNGKSFEWISCDLEISAVSRNSIEFRITNNGNQYPFEAHLDKQKGFTIESKSIDEIIVLCGNERRPADEFFMEYKPVIRMPDGGQIEGGTQIKPRKFIPQQIDNSNLVVKDWSKTKITDESLWKNGKKRASSVQGTVIDALIQDSRIQIVFDDDDSGEIADVISISEIGNDIHVGLYHCKFAGSTNPGSSASDLYVVSGQAEKGVHWTLDFDNIVRTMIKREKDSLNGRNTRFHQGDIKLLEQLRRKSFRTRVIYNVVIVQPGLSKSKFKAEHSSVFGAASLFIRQHLATDLNVWISS
jgi:superfamily II DNA or RNA helicase